MYKKTITANSYLFKYNINFVFILKYENIYASYIEVATNIYHLLNNVLYQYLFLADIKHGYWAVNVYYDNCYDLAFHVHGIRQVQLTSMSQGAKTLYFIFSKLINITLRLILSPQMESILHLTKTAKNIVSLTFYIDNIFRAFKTD